jgi:hypothetical protein
VDGGWILAIARTSYKRQRSPSDCANERKKEDMMTHPKQLDEVGITESYLRKMAKKEGVTYKRLVQLSMEEWGRQTLEVMNKIVAEDIKTAPNVKMSRKRSEEYLYENYLAAGGSPKFFSQWVKHNRLP